MSGEATRVQAERYRKMRLVNDAPGVTTAWRKNTSITLWYKKDRLQAYQVAWTYPITNYGSDFKTDVCTGQRFVELRLHGPEFAGASVVLDEALVGEMSDEGSLSVDVPFGEHTIVIHKTGLESLQFRVLYDERSSPHDSLDIATHHDEVSEDAQF